MTGSSINKMYCILLNAIQTVTGLLYSTHRGQNHIVCDRVGFDEPPIHQISRMNINLAIYLHVPFVDVPDIVALACYSRSAL